MDGESLFALTDSCRPYLKEWLPWVDEIKNPEDTKSFIKLTKRQFAGNNGVQAGIFYQGKIAGVIGFHSINWANQSTDLGYWLGEQYQGKGLMVRACKAFINYAFKELELNRVEIRCAAGNIKSRAIPECLGFVEEGMIRDAEWLYDHYVDHVVYGLLRREYEE